VTAKRDETDIERGRRAAGDAHPHGEPAHTGLVHERYATVEHDAEGRPRGDEEDESLMERLGKKLLD
jgi:hypothetical protein